MSQISVCRLTVAFISLRVNCNLPCSQTLNNFSRLNLLAFSASDPCAGETFNPCLSRGILLPCRIRTVRPGCFQSPPQRSVHQESCRCRKVYLAPRDRCHLCQTSFERHRRTKTPDNTIIKTAFLAAKRSPTSALVSLSVCPSVRGQK